MRYIEHINPKEHGVRVDWYNPKTDELVGTYFWTEEDGTIHAQQYKMTNFARTFWFWYIGEHPEDKDLECHWKTMYMDGTLRDWSRATVEVGWKFFPETRVRVYSDKVLRKANNGRVLALD